MKLSEIVEGAPKCPPSFDAVVEILYKIADNTSNFEFSEDFEWEYDGDRSFNGEMSFIYDGVRYVTSIYDYAEWDKGVYPMGMEEMDDVKDGEVSWSKYVKLITDSDIIEYLEKQMVDLPTLLDVYNSYHVSKKSLREFIKLQINGNS